MAYLTIDDLDVKGKKVLMRVDFNVPLDDNQHITDDFRIRAAMPSINKLIEGGAKLILMSHLGRPKGKKVPELSLRPVAERLQKDYEHVAFVPDCIGRPVKDVVNSISNGSILLLENLRFYSGEKKNDPEFAKKIAALGDIYINDAFGTSHRAHASMAGVAAHFEKRAAGYLLQKEIKYLGEYLNTPKKPYTAVLGGAKVSGKIDIIDKLLPKVDNLIIGGGMSFTFWKAQGNEIGKSLLEKDKIDVARDVLKKAQELGCNIYLPEDALVALEIDNKAETAVVSKEKMVADQIGVDIGPKTIETFSKVIEDSNTVLWNGPMGVFEIPKFAKGTEVVARKLAEITGNGAVTIIGGGDSASAIKTIGLNDQVTHVSTGGGASLEMLSGCEMIPIQLLSEK